MSDASVNLRKPLKAVHAFRRRVLETVKALRPFAVPLLILALLVSVIPATFVVSSAFHSGGSSGSGDPESEGYSHPAGPLAYWPFDDASDSTPDDKAHGNDGTISGATYQGGTDIAPVPSNQDALSFDGDDDSVSITGTSLTGASLKGSSAVTIAAWINPDATNGVRTIYRENQAGDATSLTRAGLFMVGGGKVSAGGRSDTESFQGETTTTGVSTGGWTHVAAIINVATDDVRIFFDGVEKATTGTVVFTNSALPSTDPGGIAIGSHPQGVQEEWEGDIDEVQVYNRTLSVEEITFLVGTQNPLFVDADGDVGFGGSIDCDGVGVGAFTVIQDAVDAASAGDTVRLCDGTYHQSVTIGPEDSELQIRAARGAHPVIDGGGTADAGATLDPQFAIRLLDDVSDIEIRDLEIRDVPGSRGSAIVAWAVSTSYIIVRNNHFHDNNWNGVLVGSEGDFLHSRWKVEGNLVEDNGFVGIELTNCNRCTVRDNAVEGSGFANIVVQARNTVAGSGQVTVEQVEVEDNLLEGSLYGIYVLSITSHPTLFTPILDASTLLREVELEENVIEGASASGIRFWAFNDAATAEDGEIEDNEISCPAAGATGIGILERGLDSQSGTVRGVEVEDNDIDERCDPALVDEGEDTEVDDDDDDEGDDGEGDDGEEDDEEDDNDDEEDDDDDDDEEDDDDD